MEALLPVLSPSAFAALALEHTDGEPSHGVHHRVFKLWLSPAFAPPLFAGFQAGKFVAAEIVHRTPALPEPGTAVPE
jgi:hypothetical protein